MTPHSAHQRCSIGDASLASLSPLRLVLALPSLLSTCGVAQPLEQPLERVSVATGEQLQRDVNRGALHTLVTAHVDTRGLDESACSDDWSLCVDTCGFWSIQGNCSQVTDESLAKADVFATPSPNDTEIAVSALLPDQCVVRVDRKWLRVDGGLVWVHNLHVVLGPRAPAVIDLVVLVEINQVSRMWVTAVGLQGDKGEGRPFGTEQTGNRPALVLFEDSYLADFTFGKGGAALRAAGSNVALRNVTVRRCRSPHVRYKGAIEVVAFHGSVLCDVCTFDAGSVPYLAVLEGGSVYSNPAGRVWNQDTQLFERAHEPGEAPEETHFLDASDEMFVALRQGLQDASGPLAGTLATAPVPVDIPAAPACRVRGPHGTPGGDMRPRPTHPTSSPLDKLSEKALPMALLGAAAATGAGALVALLLIALRRRRKAGAAAKLHGGGSKATVTDSCSSMCYTNIRPGLGALQSAAQREWDADGAADMVTQAPPTVIHTTQVLEKQAGRGGSRLSPGALAAIASASGCGSESASPPPSSPRTGVTMTTSVNRPLMNHQDAARSEAKRDTAAAALGATLDRMHVRGTLLFGRFILVGAGAEHRRHGGQALVQYVLDKTTIEPLAAKFFTRTADFERERELYQVDALRAVMPNLVFATEGGEQPGEGAAGDVPALPPCLIMDRGESMKEFVAAAGHDLLTTVQALGHVAKRLAALHSHGWVHRDLKPGNLLWSPTKRSWSLLDFGCAARDGERAGVAYSLTYAAPEVLEAVERRATHVAVTTATDVWSLGIIAVEMLSEAPIFPSTARKEDVFDAVLGRTPMPWEAGSNAELLLDQLGVFREAILACLQRDPGRRIGCRELYEQWTHVFASSQHRPAVV